MEALTSIYFLFFATCVHCVIIIMASTPSAPPDPVELCRLMKQGTQFRRPGKCNEYISCNNQTGTVYSCVSPYAAYDSDRKACVKTLSSCDTTSICKGINGKWIANPNNCNGYYYCSKGDAKAGYCGFGYHFDESKQQCTFEETSECDVVPNICSFLPDKTKLRDDNDCTVYYECSNGRKLKKSCRNTYFDVESGSCVDKQLVACTKHPKPANICGTDARPKPGFKGDSATCRGYFYCNDLGIVMDLEPVWGQCPDGLFFNPKSASCAQPADIYCIYNRCDGRPDGYVLSSRNNCRNYIKCKNGIEVEERTCSGDKFFDETVQACVRYIVASPCCDGQK